MRVPADAINAWNSNGCSMHLLLLIGSAALTAPGIYLRFADATLPPWAQAALFGMAILGSALLLAWAAEVAQLEISQALALAILALIAVLPEYAVDLYFAWTAADRPEYVHYATANMTGANRLLVGVGWPLIVLLFFMRFRKGWVGLSPTSSIDVGVLLLATLYAFIIPFKGTLSLLDTVLLVGLFAFYIWRTAKVKATEPELVGPAEYLGTLPRTPRRLVTVGLFLFSATVILLVAEPFAESLIASGEHLGIDEFLLVQWLAPLASESPEFIIAGMWALRGVPEDGLGALVSSKVNQWTLLIGTLPLVYSINLGEAGRMPLDLRQQHEIHLTAAQSLLAVALLVDRDLKVWESVLLIVLFTAQLVVPDIRMEVTAVYLVIALGLFVRRRRAAGVTLATLWPRGRHGRAASGAAIPHD